MARTAITVGELTDAGITHAATTGSVDGVKFPNFGDEIIQVTSTGATSRNLTIQTPVAHDDLAVAERIIAVPAGTTKYIGNLNPSRYARKTDPDRGFAYVDFDATAPTELNVRVLRNRPAQ